MTNVLISLVLLTQTGLSNRCCQFMCDKDSCNNAEWGSGCKWLDYGIADSLIVDGQQCRSMSWGDCGECCPSCPATPSKSNNHTTTCPVEIPCPAVAPPSYESQAEAAVTSSTDVLSKIEASKTPGCVAEGSTCSDTEELYLSNDFYFEGVQYGEGDDSCCYNYRSERLHHKPDCSDQSEPLWSIMFDVDCPSSDWEISHVSDENIAKSSDSMTCMEGIKIDEPCYEACAYIICIKWLTLGAGVCPLTTSWIMGTIDDMSSYGSLQQGIPSCVMQYEQPPTEELMASGADDSDIRAYFERYDKYSAAQWAAMVVVVLCLCAFYSRRHSCIETAGDYKTLKNDVENRACGYMSAL